MKIKNRIITRLEVITIDEKYCCADCPFVDWNASTCRLFGRLNVTHFGACKMFYCSKNCIKFSREEE